MLSPVRGFGTTAGGARQQFPLLWTRESLLRLGLAFVLAVALWLYVTSKQDPTQAFDYPYPLTVTAQNVREGLTLTNNLSSVRVRVQANRNTTPISQTSFHTFVDLKGIGQGVHDVNVSVLADPGIQVLRVSPATVRVRLDALKEKHISVRVQIYDRPPRGYSAGGTNVNPSTVTVSGPENSLSQISDGVAYISLRGATSNLSGVYPVSLENAQGATIPPKLLNIAPANVHVQVGIASPSKGRSLPIVPQLVGRASGGLGVVSVTTVPSTVTVDGSSNALAGTSAIYTAPVSIARRAHGSFTQRVRLRPPSGLHATVSFVAVRVTLGQTEAGTLLSVPVVPLGTVSSGRIRVRPTTILVSVTGPASEISRAAGKARATVDIRGLKRGSYLLNPQIHLPTGLRQRAVYPSRVQVRVTG